MSAKQADKWIRKGADAWLVVASGDVARSVNSLAGQTEALNGVEQQWTLTADEEARASSFLSDGAQLDQFVNNKLILGPAPSKVDIQVNHIRNKLWVNSRAGRATNCRMYQRSDLYWKPKTEANLDNRRQVGVGNEMHLQNLDVFEGLINLTDTLFVYNVFIVPAHLVDVVTSRLAQQHVCVGNKVISSGETATALLEKPLSSVLAQGSPREYFLDKVFASEGLPVGAAKHLLEIQDSDLRDDFAAVLRQYQDVCPGQLPAELPPNRGIDDEFRIDLVPGAKPVAAPPYRQPAMQQQLIQEQVKSLLESGLIRPSASPFSSPVLLVRKPDGSLRFCVDYRSLNKRTIRDKFPLPRTEDLVDGLAGSTVYSNLDLRSGYWQLRLSEDSVEKTAFVTADGQWEWLVLPFGLTNAPSGFQRVMAKALHGLPFVKVYLDDIIVHSKTVQEHLTHLGAVLERLRQYKFYLKLTKCRFLQDKVTFLGHEVDASGLHIASDKISAVTDWPTPKTVRDVRSFLGFVQFFRRSLKDLAGVSLPLVTLTRKDVAWRWGKVEQDAFATIKRMVTSAPCLALVDFSDESLDVELHTDASAYALGGVLFVRQDGHLRPVAYHSRKFTPPEQLYHTTERELLAVVDSLVHFRHYLLGRPFLACTDHAPLTSFFGSKLKGRALRWQQTLAEFQPGMRLVYLPGSRNVAADQLSRRPDYIPVDVSLDLPQTSVQVPVDVQISDVFDALQQGRLVSHVLCPSCRTALPPNTCLYAKSPAQKRTVSCPTCSHQVAVDGLVSPLGKFSPVVRSEQGATGIFLTVQGSPPGRGSSSLLPAGGDELSDDEQSLNGVHLLHAFTATTPRLDLAGEIAALQAADDSLAALHQRAEGTDPLWRKKDGVLYRVDPDGDRLVVPRQLEDVLLAEFHDHTGHLGQHRTSTRLASRYWFPNLHRKVKEYIRRCDVCQRTKVSNRKPGGLLQPIPMSEEPWRDVALDLLVDLPSVSDLSTILVVVDRFSKMVRLLPLGRDTTTATLADAFFDNIVKIHGVPATLISDRDVRFQSNLWKEIMKRVGTELRFSTAYHPQTDGQSERAIRSISQMLRALVYQFPKEWPRYLAKVELFYNTTVQRSTNKAPFEVVYGRNVQLPADLIGEQTGPATEFLKVWAEARKFIERAQADQKRFADRRRESVSFAVGDYVLLHTRHLPIRAVGSRKLQQLWVGPYKVTQVVGSGAYKLALPASLSGIHPVFNVSQLKAYVGDVIPPPDPVEIDGVREYEVEALLAHRRSGRRKRLEYLVKFVGYDTSHNEWLPVSHLSNAQELVAAYNQAKGL